MGGDVSFNIAGYLGKTIGISLTNNTFTGDDFSYTGDLDYLLLNGISYQSVSEGTPPPYFDPAIPNSFVGSLRFENIVKERVG